MMIKVKVDDPLTEKLNRFDKHEWECILRKIGYQVWLKLIEKKPGEEIK